MSIKESLLRAKTWISRCLREHVSCQIPLLPPLPKRIIEVEGNEVRLTETSGQYGRYIALSHCWGDSRSPCFTTTVTIEGNMRGIAWTSLPSTFRDAILVCRELGIRYLWIDSICIIQDSEADWEEESGKMAAIYHNSYLTICATAAQNDDDGLWTNAPKIVPRKIVVQRLFRNFEVYIRPEEELDIVHLYGYGNVIVWPKMMALSPLMARGWTFQERLMSPRLLHFSHGELLWQCRELKSCECSFDAKKDGSSSYMDHGWDRELFVEMVSSKSCRSIATTWRNIVKQYSGLSLSFQKDMLPALSGLAKICLQMRPGDRYLAGLWEQSLIDDLAWNPCYNLPTKPRPEVFRAPSWSWASVTESVMFGESSDEIHARVVRASTILAGLDPTGEVRSGSIVLLAPFELATIAQVNSPFFSIRVRGANRDIQGAKADTTTDVEDGSISQGNSVLCLCLKTMPDRCRDEFVLILVAVDGRPKLYRRVGHMRIKRNVADSWFKQEIEIEIV
ncbi:hypothetical protein OIDMADRAFT_150338 [Oidiodendron maius Zn]|uniref:Heterokaryon incompatibility domain-containing protein n=1 Tax=Oidiodendron maius (strain Zn) TaxID=913774 RepID=A0A0C3HVP9_OIDMZ|nr:hypothetical protein OIDMADRAFT_150338 [Oidiodendron maius Zn]